MNIFQKVNRMLCSAVPPPARLLAFATFLLITCHLSLSKAYAQRDFFTPEEVEMIRDAQQIDNRVDLLAKIIDRRFAGMGVDTGGAKVPAKDDAKWGTQPTARGELLLDIKSILQKAIDDIDNLAERPESMVVEPGDPRYQDNKKPKGFGDLFPKAVRKLAAGAERWKPALQTQLAATKDEKDRGSILDSIDMCDEIIASVAKLSSMQKH